MPKIFYLITEADPPSQDAFTLTFSHMPTLSVRHKRIRIETKIAKVIWLNRTQSASP